MAWKFKILTGSIFSIFIIAVLLAFHPVLTPIRSGNIIPVSGDCTKHSGETLIILDGSGLNSSRSLGALILHVLKGDRLNLLLCNQDNVQAHGFGIDHYFDIGVTLKPGQIYRISVTLKESGSYTIYCNVFCTVHPSMIGKLIVS